MKNPDNRISENEKLNGAVTIARYTKPGSFHLNLKEAEPATAEQKTAYEIGQVTGVQTCGSSDLSDPRRAVSCSALRNVASIVSTVAINVAISACLSAASCVLLFSLS